MVRAGLKEREGKIMAGNIFTKCPECGRLIAGDYCSHPTKEREGK